MLGKLYLLANFNNYFNRKVIYKSELQNYLDTVGSDGYFLINSTNFNPNDGVSTDHVIGSAGLAFNKVWNPDYCLYVEGEEIKSRWFVTKCERLRDSQYKIRLKRDTVADYYYNVILAPAFIERGTLSDSDPLIVNDEGVRVNQIKTDEYYLKDETKVPWAIVYLNQGSLSGDTYTPRPSKTIHSTYSSPAEIAWNADLQAVFGDAAHFNPNYSARVFNDSLSIRWHYGYRWNDILYVGSCAHTGVLDISPASHNAWMQEKAEGSPYMGNTNYPEGPWGHGNVNGWDSMGTGITPRQQKEMMNEVGQNIQNDFNNFVSPLYQRLQATTHSTGFVDLYDRIKNYNGKTIIGPNNKKYILSIERKTDVDQIDEENDDFGNMLKSKIDAVNHSKWSYSGKVRMRARLSLVENFQLRETVGASIDCTIPSSSQFQTQLQNYDIICFPVFNTKMIKSDGTQQDCYGIAGMNIARNIPKQMGSDNCYDVQILPYCPVRELIDPTTGYLDLRLAGANQYCQITAESQVVGYGVFATNPFQSFEITKAGKEVYGTSQVNVVDIMEFKYGRKVASNCDLYRLSSPNYASMFEFNSAKCTALSGSYISMSKFKVDICFRPYNPYIHICPDFSFLYGRDFNDSRGLICSGDFGMTTLSNAWTDYQVRNKNYQNIFDRQIENMEVLHGFEKDQYALNIAMGVAMGGALGATAGSKIPGGVLIKGIGAVAGGAMGGTLGGVAAAKDNEINEKSYLENRSLAEDLHRYQLDNIKAMPNTITHCATFTNNFKFFPVLEYYTCTRDERIAFQDYLKYKGMTVGKVDCVATYMSLTEERYIQGKIIRLNYTLDDSNISNDIYNEVSKGLFFVPNN